MHSMGVPLEAKSNFSSLKGLDSFSPSALYNHRGNLCALQFLLGSRTAPESKACSVELHISKHPQKMGSVQKLEKFWCSN